MRKKQQIGKILLRVHMTILRVTMIQDYKTQAYEVH